jgi:hypothetical protein
MTAWKDTATELFTEADTAKEAAKTAFLAGLTPPNPPCLPLSKVIPLADAMTTASWQALLKHIGPVSSDGSVTIGIQWTTDPVPVPQLDLKAVTATSRPLWFFISADPSIIGLTAPMKYEDGGPSFCVQFDENDGDPIGLWIKTGSSDTAWSKIWPVIQHRGIGPATIDGSGIVTLSPYHTSELTMISGGTINGIKKYTSADTSFARGDDHRLVVFGATHTAPIDIINGASVGVANLAFCLPYSAGTDANARENFRFKASPAVFNLYIDPTVSVYLDGGKPSP